MPVTGGECAEVLRQLTRDLDAEATRVLRQSLEGTARHLLTVAGFDAPQPELVEGLTDWMSRSPDVRALRTRLQRGVYEYRSSRDEWIGLLDDTSRERLSRAMAMFDADEPRITRSMTTRQRRRNVHSQARSILNCLSPDWLREQFLAGAGSESAGHLVEMFAERARALAEAPIEGVSDFQSWSQEVSHLYARIVDSLATARSAESRRPMSASTSATTRTYQNSWRLFLATTDAAELMMRLRHEPDAGVYVPVMFAVDDGSSPMRFRLRHRVSRYLWPEPRLLAEDVQSSREWQSRVTSLSSQPHEDFSRFAPIGARTPNASRGDLDLAVDEIAAPADVSEESVTVALFPQARPADGYELTWNSLEQAQSQVSERMMNTAAMSEGVPVWDFHLTYRRASQSVTVKRSGMPLEEACVTAAKLASGIASLL